MRGDLAQMDTKNDLHHLSGDRRMEVPLQRALRCCAAVVGVLAEAHHRAYCLSSNDLHHSLTSSAISKERSVSRTSYETRR